MNDNESLSADMLRGANEIADFLGLDKRQVYHAASTGKLPVFHIGSIVHARKSTLMGWIQDQESAAA